MKNELKIQMVQIVIWA